MQEKRLAKLEAGLEGREKVLAWLHVNQQQGGFLDVTTRYFETNGASRRPLDIEDVESRFIYLCSVDCNMRALELQEARLQKGLFRRVCKAHAEKRGPAYSPIRLTICVMGT